MTPHGRLPPAPAGIRARERAGAAVKTARPRLPI